MGCGIVALSRGAGDTGAGDSRNAAAAVRENISASDNGGWFEDPSAVRNGIRVDRCDVPVVHASTLTKALFESRYRGREPVVIEGLIDDWKVRSARGALCSSMAAEWPKN